MMKEKQRMEMGDSVKIEPLANGSLRVWLSEEEENIWGIDSRGASSRRVLRRLLRHIFRQLDCREPAHLLVEQIPVEGGSVLLVTPTTYPSAASPAVYHIADADGLLELMRQWRLCADEAAEPHCCLYEQGEGYDLAVYPVTPLSAGQQHLLAEYGSLLGVGEGVAAHCGEYGTLLMTGDLFTAPVPEPSAPLGQPH